MEEDPPRWLYDPLNADFVQLHSIGETIYSVETSFQSVQIINTPGWGTCLVLDGKIQSSEHDEFIYHETLVYPALILHECPEKVLIAGGGEGATLREVLALRSIKRAVMVDLDKEAVDVCRQYLGSWHCGAFEDPRTELLHLDARKYLAETEEHFDIIIMDVTDPMVEGPSSLLFTQEFYALAKGRLNPGGILAVQSELCGWGDESLFTAIANTIGTVFPSVFPYQTHVPCFGTMWGFVLAGDILDPLAVSVEKIDQMIEKRVSKQLRFYDGMCHFGLFSLPKNLREKLKSNRIVITDERPLYVYQ
ncbi:MAG: polyamine aminopropyltransferase [Chloroflexota bacterium]|nr:polyamine aminopropyltransferase [Chloroflexota bacterium]